MTSPWLPPEWAEQSAVLLVWPHPKSDWAADLVAIEALYTEFALAISARQHLLLAVHDEALLARVETRLRLAGTDMGRVSMAIAPCNDTWVRDYGPLSIRRGATWELQDFRFNGWGGKFDASLDDRATGVLHAAGLFGDTELNKLDMVLEGGGIECDGHGGLLTTASCLLSPSRNPGLDRAGVEAELKRHLGAERVMWLRHGALEGDDTDGHIDTLARFCDAHTIAYQACGDPADSHYAPLGAMARELAELRDHRGEAYRLVPLPLPRPIHDPEDGHRLPAGYANFLIINGAVIVPVYDDPADEVALQRLRDCLPEHEIIAIDSRAAIRQHGGLHCLSMQIPREVLEPKA